jgi:two-component system cell cycle sensor histidine kinase/response regulator CckA
VALLLGAEHLHLGAVAGWAVLVTVAAAALWRHEVRRAEAERALRESEARLHQAQKMEAVGRLAGGVAHDINNYLAGIRTHCELLLGAARRGDLEPERAAARLEAVVGTVLKASSLVERLLTFGRRQPGRPEVVDLNEVVETFARSFGGGLGEGVELETRLGDGLPPVEVDLSQVEQALANLVVNARDALDGPGTIVVATERRPAAGAEGVRVCLRVTDTGRGIPSEIREQIFDPFFSTRQTVGASGLGLASVYAVVEEAGGRIEVESATEGPERGSTFRILLPPAGRSLPELQGPEGSASPARPGRSEPPGGREGGGERILLADDDAEVRAATRSLLESLGYRVEAVASAAAAVEAADAARAAGDPFVLAVTDVRLGELSGPDLVARLREAGPIRALYMSGYTDRIELRSGLARGPGRGDAFFLKKPFSGEGLARMVRELLGLDLEGEPEPPSS